MSFRDKIVYIQETFGMSNKKVAEILHLDYGTFRNYMYNTPKQLTADHVRKLKLYIKDKATELK